MGESNATRLVDDRERRVVAWLAAGDRVPGRRQWRIQDFEKGRKLLRGGEGQIFS
jgi:hypothetical protein